MSSHHDINAALYAGQHIQWSIEGTMLSRGQRPRDGYCYWGMTLFLKGYIQFGGVGQNTGQHLLLHMPLTRTPPQCFNQGKTYINKPSYIAVYNNIILHLTSPPPPLTHDNNYYVITYPKFAAHYMLHLSMRLSDNHNSTTEIGGYLECKLLQILVLAIWLMCESKVMFYHSYTML